MQYADTRALRKIDQKYLKIDHKYLKIDQKYLKIDQKYLKIDQKYLKIDQKCLKIDQKYLKIDQKYLKIDQKYLKIDQKYLKIDQKYLKIDHKYLKIDQKYLKIDQKYLKRFKMWCWRRMENISCTDCVRFGEVLHRVKEERNIVQTIKQRKNDWLGYIWRGNCLQIEGRIEVTGRRGRRRGKQLLDDLQERRSHWKLKEEALDRTV